MEYEITPEELSQKLAGGESITVVDVREPAERQIAVIEPSSFMPMGEVPARAHQELDPDDHIVVYCHHGVRSMSVTAWLRQQGFEHAQSLRGGIDEWARKIDPKIPTY